jgi:hypothetical protein
LRRRSEALRLRAGVILWLLSWTPIPVIFGISGVARTIVWGMQALIGIFGLALAGSSFAATVKQVGWKHAPRVVWHVLIHPTGDGDAPEREGSSSEHASRPERS